MGIRYLPKHPYVWVLTAILLGGAIGYFAPHAAVALKPLGDGFISLIKMLVAPVVFLTVGRHAGGRRCAVLDAMYNKSDNSCNRRTRESE